MLCHPRHQPRHQPAGKEEESGGRSERNRASVCVAEKDGRGGVVLLGRVPIEIDNSRRAIAKKKTLLRRKKKDSSLEKEHEKENEATHLKDDARLGVGG